MKTKRRLDHPLLVIPCLPSALIGLHKEGRGAERMEKGEREGRWEDQEMKSKSRDQWTTLCWLSPAWLAP